MVKLVYQLFKRMYWKLEPSWLAIKKNQVIKKKRNGKYFQVRVSFDLM